VKYQVTHKFNRMEKLEIEKHIEMLMKSYMITMKLVKTIRKDNINNHLDDHAKEAIRNYEDMADKALKELNQFIKIKLKK